MRRTLSRWRVAPHTGPAVIVHSQLNRIVGSVSQILLRTEVSFCCLDGRAVFGGSRSQVQFPAELSGFFGLSNRPRPHTEVRRAVVFAALEYPCKKMDFHHNDVWRLNLPTAKQGRALAAIGGWSWYSKRPRVRRSFDCGFWIQELPPQGSFGRAVRGEAN